MLLLSDFMLHQYLLQLGARALVLATQLLQRRLLRALLLLQLLLRTLMLQ